MPHLIPSLVLAVAPGAATKTGVTWLIARDLGFLTYVLATASVLLGLSTSTRTGDRTVGRGAIYDSHRALALLTLIALGGHILFLALDNYAKFSISSLFIPFTIWYRPFWSSLGILAAYLVVTIYASFYVRSRIGYRTWRIVHFATFAVFVLAVVHGFMAGTDAKASWAVLLYVFSVGAVAVMMTYRLLRGANVNPRWAWMPDFGDEGAARLAFALGTVMVALALTGVVLLTSGTQPTTAAVDDDTEVEAPAASAPAAQTDPATLPDASEPELRRRAGNAVFSGSAGSNGWRLTSPSLAGAELDVTNAGQLSLIRLDTGQAIFQTSAAVTISGDAGPLQVTLDGVGPYVGGYMTIDGNYQVTAGQVNLAAHVEVATPVSR